MFIELRLDGGTVSVNVNDIDKIEPNHGEAKVYLRSSGPNHRGHTTTRSYDTIVSGLKKSGLLLRYESCLYPLDTEDNSTSYIKKYSTLQSYGSMTFTYPDTDEIREEQIKKFNSLMENSNNFLKIKEFGNHGVLLLHRDYSKVAVVLYGEEFHIVQKEDSDTFEVMLTTDLMSEYEEEL